MVSIHFLFQQLEEDCFAKSFLDSTLEKGSKESFASEMADEANLSELKLVDDEQKENAEKLKEKANEFFKSKWVTVRMKVSNMTLFQ